MDTFQYLKLAFALACAILTPLTVSGQDYVTKSGTPIAPAEKTAILLPPESKSSDLHHDTYAGHYHIVVPADLLAPLQPFIQWKRQQGFLVQVVIPETIHRDSIRTALSRLYSSRPHLRTYILLVGDMERIPSFSGKHTPDGLNIHITDLYYAEYTGDYLPEAMVGRLSVADTLQLARVIDKIVAYEQGAYAQQLSQLLLVAGSESRTPAPVTTNGQVNYLATLSATHRPDVDTVCFRNPASASQRDSILLALNGANTFVNYTAHCTQTRWTNPSFTVDDVDSLPLSTPTLFFNNCCRANAFGGDCLGERLLRKPDGGAVGIIGATNETLWAEDYYWAVGAKYPLSITPPYDPSLPGAFDPVILNTANCYMPAEPFTLGDMMHLGCRAVTTAGSPFDAFYWETYCLLGDPSMTPFWPDPDTLTLVLDDSLWVGKTTLHLHCTPHARITATADTLLLGTAVVPENGEITLQLDRSIDADSITLTATRPDALCNSQQFTVHHPALPYLAVVDCSLDDTLLHLRVKNQGLSPALHHCLSLTQGEAPGVILPAFPAIDLPLLPSLADTLLAFNLHDCQPGSVPLLSAIITLHDSTGTVYSTLPLNISLPDRRPLLTQLQILEPDNTPCRLLLPGHDYLLSVTLANPADSFFLSLASYEAASLTPCPSQFTIPFRTPDSLTHLQLSLTPHYGDWHRTYTYWLTCHRTTEPFETADFSNLPWQHPTLYHWLIDSLAPHNGTYCARSAPIDNALQSSLVLDINTIVDDSVSFFYNLSSEHTDWLYFYIDGHRRGFWSGNTGWQRYARLLPAGQHRLEWVYRKDASGSQHDDCARIDDLRLPLALWQQPAGTPMADTHTIAIPHPGEQALRPFTISPNPASSLIRITHDSQPVDRTITLIDNLGRTVDKIKIHRHTSSTQYSTTHLRLGTYTLVLSLNAGVYIQKMTVIR